MVACVLISFDWFGLDWLRCGLFLVLRMVWNGCYGYHFGFDDVLWGCGLVTLCFALLQLVVLEVAVG